MSSDLLGRRRLHAACVFIFYLVLKNLAVTAAPASEVSLQPALDEYVTAYLNFTYITKGKFHMEKNENAKYGIGKVSDASGIVVHVRSMNTPFNHFGCEYPFGNAIPNEPWIALVKRGSCNFDKKLENAWRSNASALLVYDKEEKETLERMGLRNCQLCDIPGVFTYKYKGEEIANLTDNGTRVILVISIGETCTSPRPYNSINRTSVLFVSISFIVLMIISLAWLVFYYVQRFRYLHAKDRLAQRLCNAAKKALAKIPTRNIKVTDKEISGDGECCPVCIELYRSGDTLRTLPCKHEFHKCCVDPWLLEHRTCPMCKMDILKYYGYIFTGSQESILHLDLEDGVLNSSESRDTDTPTHDPLNRQMPQVEDVPQSTSTVLVAHRQSVDTSRKPSLISLTVVSSVKNNSPAPTCDETSMGTSPPKTPCEIEEKSPSCERLNGDSPSPVNMQPSEEPLLLDKTSRRASSVSCHSIGVDHVEEDDPPLSPHKARQSQ